VATVTPNSALNASIAQARSQVQRDVVREQQDSERLSRSEAQVRQDSDRLSQSQAQLEADQRQLAAVQQQARAQVNTQGQTVGKLINTKA
jgi:phage shock protein A